MSQREEGGPGGGPAGSSPSAPGRRPRAAPLRSGATLDAARAAALDFATSEALYARVTMAAELADWAEVAEGGGCYLVRITDPVVEGTGHHRHIGPFADIATALAHADAIRAELVDMLVGTDEEPWLVEVLPLFAPQAYAQPPAQRTAQPSESASERGVRPRG